MKKLKKFKAAILLISAMILFSVSSRAQEEGEAKINIQYNVAVPVGTFKDFVSKATGRAWNANILYGITDQWAAGIELSYRDFYEKYPRAVYHTSDGSDISAVISNTAEAIPFMLKARYNFTHGKKMQPFASVSAGGSFIKIDQYLGEFSNVSKSGFAFAAVPEAGIYIPFGRNKEAGINLAVSYSILPYKYGDIKNLNHATAAIGVSIPMRR